MEKQDILEYLESRLRDNPKSLLFARLADIYLDQGKIDDGMILCTEGVKHHPYYSTGYYVLAKAHVLKKEFDKAEDALKKVLSHDQQYLAGHKMLADIMVKTGWESTAVEHYSAVLEIDPLEDKVRDLLKRYAPKPAQKTPLLAPTEDPSAAIEEIPAIEARTSPALPEASEMKGEIQAAPPVIAETAPQEPEFPSLPDWTDQIKEFQPYEKDLTASAPPPAPEIDFGAFDEPSEVAAAPIPEIAPVEPPAAVPAPSETIETDRLESPPAASDTGMQPEVALPDKPVEDEASAQKEKLTDFTQDWFDITSFEKPEEPPPEKKRAEEPQKLEIVDAGPGPAEPPKTESEPGLLFEKEEPREILAPSDLRPADLQPAEPEKPKTPSPTRSKPPAAAGPVAGRKRPEFLMPKAKEKKAETPPPAEPGSRPGKPSATAPRSDEKPEAKIVTSTLGEIYAVQGQFDKAIQVYEALLEKNPKEQKYLDKIADLKKKLKEASGK